MSLLDCHVLLICLKVIQGTMLLNTLGFSGQIFTIISLYINLNCEYFTISGVLFGHRVYSCLNLFFHTQKFSPQSVALR